MAPSSYHDASFINMRYPSVSRGCFLLIVSSMVMSLPDVLASGNVTIVSIVIFRTHEWLGKPSVYFRCQGEKKVYLPDVVEKDHHYKFIGEESWQPITSLEGSKCKRCGLYEEDILKQDDIFDEWELCPIEFSLEHEGHCNHFKEKELNITFVCPHCYPSDSKPANEPADTSNEADEKPGKKNTLIILLTFIGFVLLIGITSVGYLKWQKKKREEQQARFIKLFEDDDDLEAELGLRDL